MNMKFKQDEIVGISISVVVAIIFFVGLRYGAPSFLYRTVEVPVNTDNGIVTLDATNKGGMIQVLHDAVTSSGKITKLIIEDSKMGTGTAVQNGSHVVVNYVGMLQDGTQFDNSFTKGEPYSFVVGAGSVIKGWDMGLVGMKAGGERILVIPPDLAYGAKAMGPIPPKSTLLFSIELVSVQ